MGKKSSNSKAVKQKQAQRKVEIGKKKKESDQTNSPAKETDTMIENIDN